MNWVNAYTARPGEIQENTASAYKVVAVHWGEAWCAYRGPADWSNDQVVGQGDQIEKNAAVHLFPVYAGLGLRYYNP